jgi:hypothetical protein
MKASLKSLLYVCLSVTALAVLAVGSVDAFLQWEYHLPSDQRARQQFENHRAEFVRFASMLRQNQGPRVVDGNGLDDAFEKDARAVPEYRELMRSTGAMAANVRPDGSIEFQLWGFGCAPCTDSYKGMRYSPTKGKRQTGFEWVPKVVRSLDDENLPKKNGAVADWL